jgi:hypothetical protein
MLEGDEPASLLHDLLGLAPKVDVQRCFMMPVRLAPKLKGMYRIRKQQPSGIKEPLVERSFILLMEQVDGIK